MKPERLLVLWSKEWNDDVLIEALFMDEDTPIVLRARLPFEEREFFADVFSTNEGSAEAFSSTELLDACWCAGCLEPEHKEHIDETRALLQQCTEPSGDNDGV